MTKCIKIFVIYYSISLNRYQNDIKLILMIIRGKEVTYSYHMFERLYRVKDLGIVNETLLTGKWKPFGKNMFKVTRKFKKRKIMLVVKELPDRFKMITVEGD